VIEVKMTEAITKESIIVVSGEAIKE